MDPKIKSQCSNVTLVSLFTVLLKFGSSKILKSVLTSCVNIPTIVDILFLFEHFFAILLIPTAATLSSTKEESKCRIS